MHPMLNIAFSAARKASSVIMRYLDRLDTINVREKSLHDFVSDVDKQAEQEIIYIIRKAYPNHKIVAEESGTSKGSEENIWIIDPLDGTTNYVHGVPHFCVSIAFQHRGKLLHGLIYDPIRQELFTASQGSGARLNNKRLRVSGQRKFEDAYLSTGFPDSSHEQFPNTLKIFSSLLPQVADIRTLGSACLDLAYVAAGRLDGYWEMGIQPWDMAAGALLVQEAGGFVSDVYGSENYLQHGSIVAANTNLFKPLLQNIKIHLQTNNP